MHKKIIYFTVFNFVICIYIVSRIVFAEKSVEANLPAWSEDGKRIAFAADDAVWAVELTGGEPVQISPTGSIARFPVWLPNPEQ